MIIISYKLILSVFFMQYRKNARYTVNRECGVLYFKGASTQPGTASMGTASFNPDQDVLRQSVYKFIKSGL